MEDSLDKTSLETISLLEARLLRIEHLLYGISTPNPRPTGRPALDSLADLERRFATLLSRVRVYAELLKIYKSNPSLFQPSSATRDPPTQLSPDAVLATVLSYATSFPATASALAAATSDTPVPDPATSAALAALRPRMAGIEALQRAQAAEIAELRGRSEDVLRRGWLRDRVLAHGGWVADVEGRVERLERGVRRAERRGERERSEI